MEPLLPSFRRELRARAHHLHPVVSIGQHGLTPAVLHEIDIALTAHELIKVRVFSDERTGREALLERICEAMDCAPVQRIGKLLVLWRKRPAGAEEARPAKPKARSDEAGRRAPATTRRRRSAAAEPVHTPSVRKRAAAPAGRKPATPPGVPETTRRARPMPGKAPAGVPRAAAPRRRRRAA
jgi:RNA-binding protein